MKIVLLSPAFPSRGNPTYIFVQQLVFALVDQGVEVVVVASQSLTHIIFRGGKVLPKLCNETTTKGSAFKVYRPYDFSFGNRLKFLTKTTDWIFNYQVKSIIEQEKPDVLYGHFWHTAYRLTNFALEYNLPLFVACGEGDNALEQLAESISPKNKRNLVKVVKGVISVSTENKRKCIAFGLAKDEDIIVLPNCVDDELFHPADASVLRHELGVSKDDFLILFVGSFTVRKGADRLSKAIEQLNEPHIKVVFVGNTIAGDVVLPSCKGIVWQGSLEHDLLPAFYNAADVFVLPTQKEGCCNAIVESLACGTPVVSSNRPFNEDILNNQNSILINPDSVEEIAEAIKTLYYNRELLKTKSIYAGKMVKSHSILKRAIKIYDFICGRMKH